MFIIHIFHIRESFIFLKPAYDMIRMIISKMNNESKWCGPTKAYFLQDTIQLKATYFQNYITNDTQSLQDFTKLFIDKRLRVF